MDRHDTASAVSRDDRVPPSLRGSEATEAIHKKVDSREAYFASAKFMDRHAVQAPLAMTENATNLKKPQDSRIFDGFCALCSGEQGDKALCLSTQRDTNSRKRRKKTESKKEKE